MPMLSGDAIGMTPFLLPARPPPFNRLPPDSEEGHAQLPAGHAAPAGRRRKAFQVRKKKPPSTDSSMPLFPEIYHTNVGPVEQHCLFKPWCFCE